MTDSSKNLIILLNNRWRRDMQEYVTAKDQVAKLGMFHVKVRYNIINVKYVLFFIAVLTKEEPQ